MKVALVTGGSRGIGAATVELFAKENYTVILNYRSSEKEASALKQRLNSEGLDVHLYRADISDVRAVDEMFLWIAKYFKHLDVLVNNAGVALYAMCQDTSSDDYDRVMDTNAKGAFFCAKHATDFFVRQGHGAIVNVSSIWGLFGASCESVYSMSKFALVGLTKSLAKELAFCNVTVNCVCPPIVKTDMCRLSQQDIDEFCRENGVSVYSAERVAQDILRLAQGSETGKILEER